MADPEVLCEDRKVQWMLVACAATFGGFLFLAFMEWILLSIGIENVRKRLALHRCFFVRGMTDIPEVVCNVAAFINFYYENIYYDVPEICLPPSINTCQMADIVFNLVFLLFMVKRIFTKNTLWEMVISPYSMADFCTIPACLYGWIIGRSFLGLRFTRIIFITLIPRVAFRTTVVVRATCSFVATLLTFAGIIQFFEDMGDPITLEDPQHHRYETWVYFVLVTMTTVGYGDFSCKTALGRLFIMVTMLFSCALFMTYIVRLVELATEKPGRMAKFRPSTTGRHAVVLGYINSDAITFMIQRIVGTSRKWVTDIVLFNNQSPLSERHSSLVSRNQPVLHHVTGTMEDIKSLLKLDDAGVCFIFADPKSSNPHETDCTNINIALDILNLSKNPIVVLQCLQLDSYRFLKSVLKRPERLELLCLTKVEMPLVARSCRCQGYLTVITDMLISEHTVKMPDLHHEIQKNRSTPQKLDVISLQNEAGEIFQDVVLKYFVKSMLLLGVGVYNASSDKWMILRMHTYSRIPPSAKGLVCISGLRHIVEVTQYPPRVKLCYQEVELTEPGTSPSDIESQREADPLQSPESPPLQLTDSTESLESIESQEEILSGGCWGHKLPAVMVGHIVIRLIRESKTTPVEGLQLLCETLQTAFMEKMTPIVLIGDRDHLVHEYPYLCDIPLLYTIQLERGHGMDTDLLPSSAMVDSSRCLLVIQDDETHQSTFRTKLICQMVPKEICFFVLDTQSALRPSSYVNGRCFHPMLRNAMMTLVYEEPHVLKFVIEILISGHGNENGMGEIDIREGILQEFEEDAYGDLVEFALKKGILCLGLSRYSSEIASRYIITNPKRDFKLKADDKAIAIVL